MLQRLPLEPDDTLVFLGDYVDRGPDGRGVVERLMRLRAERGARCVCLFGNHEEMLLDHWRRSRRTADLPDRLRLALLGISSYGEGAWLKVGGEATVRSYGGVIPEHHVTFLAELPLCHETDEYIFVHAGLRARGITTRNEMLWGAPGFWSDLDPVTGRILAGAPRTYAKTVVVGHTPFARPMVGVDIVGIDTDCGNGGPLTAVRLPERVFFQEPASALPW